MYVYDNWYVLYVLVNCQTTHFEMYSQNNIKLVSIYRVSHELRLLLRESVRYVKLYRYNPKHLCPKLNGYRDNGQRSLKL
jgi:hypothetical protein